MQQATARRPERRPTERADRTDVPNEQQTEGATIHRAADRTTVVLNRRPLDAPNLGNAVISRFSDSNGRRRWTVL